VFRIFLVGIVLGIASAGGVFHLYKPVSIHRESSVLRAIPNGSVEEIFHVTLPRDLIFAGSPAEVIPQGSNWSEAGFLGDLRVNLFKVRNQNDRVVGLASRFSGRGNADGNFTEWLVHLPARGTLYAVMDPLRSADGMRSGHLQGGTREFASRGGSITEKFSNLQTDEEPQTIIELTFQTGIRETGQ
jgi:hypothetical protein